ncbi:hypothetical protein MUP77_16350 [Candidatus Bathyarchaeota archaeon]|nr:hypothetical protein [Candidatus Bathyarchaeota archaeon]
MAGSLGLPDILRLMRPIMSSGAERIKTPPRSLVPKALVLLLARGDNVPLNVFA